MDIQNSYHSRRMRKKSKGIDDAIRVHPQCATRPEPFFSMIDTMCHNYMPTRTQMRQDDCIGTFVRSGEITLFRGLNRNFREKLHLMCQNSSHCACDLCQVRHSSIAKRIYLYRQLIVISSCDIVVQYK